MKISKELYEKHWNSLSDLKKAVINSYHLNTNIQIATCFILFFMALFFSYDNVLDSQVYDGLFFFIFAITFLLLALWKMGKVQEIYNKKFFEVKIKDEKH